MNSDMNRIVQFLEPVIMYKYCKYTQMYNCTYVQHSIRCSYIVFYVLERLHNVPCYLRFHTFADTDLLARNRTKPQNIDRDGHKLCVQKTKGKWATYSHILIEFVGAK